MVWFWYRRLHYSIETISHCRPLLRKTRMEMDWNSKKLAKFFKFFVPIEQMGSSFEASHGACKIQRQIQCRRQSWHQLYLKTILLWLWTSLVFLLYHVQSEPYHQTWCHTKCSSDEFFLGTWSGARASLMADKQKQQTQLWVQIVLIHYHKIPITSLGLIFVQKAFW